MLQQSEQNQPTPPTESKAGSRGFMGWIRHQSETGRAVPILFLLTFADACVSPILPEVILIPMILAEPHKAFRWAALCSVASALGGLFGYYIGFALWETGLDEFFFEYVFSEETFNELSQRFGEGTFYVMFLAGFTPLPYKVFTVAAGVCHEQVDLTMFILASISSRTLRFYLEVWAIKKFGPRAVQAMMRHGRWLTPTLLIIVLGIVIWSVM